MRSYPHCCHLLTPRFLQLLFVLSQATGQIPLIHNFGQGGGGGTTEQFDFGPKEYHVNLTFQQAAQGVQKDMYVSIMDTCNMCKGWL